MDEGRGRISAFGFTWLAEMKVSWRLAAITKV